MKPPSEMTDEELTSAVAEEIMGYRKAGNYYIVAAKQGLSEKEETRIRIKDWKPVLRPDHWWMVVKRMVELDFYFEIDHEIVQFWPKAMGRWEAMESFVAHPENQLDELGRTILESALIAKREDEYYLSVSFS